eukprot:3398090-Ditylum_brightwellii.AAC.1
MTAKDKPITLADLQPRRIDNHTIISAKIEYDYPSVTFFFSSRRTRFPISIPPTATILLILLSSSSPPHFGRFII